MGHWYEPCCGPLCCWGRPSSVGVTTSGIDLTSSSFLASFTGNSESLPGSLLEDADGESKATNINVKQM